MESASIVGVLKKGHHSSFQREVRITCSHDSTAAPSCGCIHE
ncbi:hypothetical protein L195_g063482, partial [Trifolium pratense]